MTTQPRAIVRHVMWTIAPDQEPNAEPMTYALQCVTCSEKSERSEDWGEPQGWGLAHSGRHPSHNSYREEITRPWRTWMKPQPGDRS
ncbi:DUF7848 domain-containing protein [Streptomyces finlayi]|uniref:DUF7848 domain-containing protein n=1 Tax=Streptomyces finlayi TaxID=67296 RepID=UPI0021562D00|nr:hypothetical protein [Streptomyces finlayi]